VQLVEAPFTAHADLLRSRQVDAVVALDPYTTQIIKAGYGRPLSWYMVETIKDQPVGSWWALRPWVREHPGEITAFNAAVKDAMVYLNDDPARAKALIAEYAGLDADLVKDMPLISWKSEIDRPVWQAVADMLHEQGELQRRHDISEYFEA
jgi:NitT/TauT family transport system substrate-binding protein